MLLRLRRDREIVARHVMTRSGDPPPTRTSTLRSRLAHSSLTRAMASRPSFSMRYHVIDMSVWRTVKWPRTRGSVRRARAARAHRARPGGYAVFEEYEDFQRLLVDRNLREA
jgi:hypothetical protein